MTDRFWINLACVVSAAAIVGSGCWAESELTRQCDLRFYRGHTGALMVDHDGVCDGVSVHIDRSGGRMRYVRRGAEEHMPTALCLDDAETCIELFLSDAERDFLTDWRGE